MDVIEFSGRGAISQHTYSLKLLFTVLFLTTDSGLLRQGNGLTWAKRKSFTSMVPAPYWVTYCTCSLASILQFGVAMQIDTLNHTISKLQPFKDMRTSVQARPCIMLLLCLLNKFPR